MSVLIVGILAGYLVGKYQNVILDFVKDAWDDFNHPHPPKYS